MANYEKTNWQTGRIITAPLMNKIENELEILDNLDEALLEIPIDLTQNVFTSTYISPSELKWQVDSGVRAVCCLIPVSQYSNCSLRITSHATSTGGRIGFLSSNAHAHDTYPDWVTDVTTDFIPLSEANTVYNFDIPTGCTYLYITKVNNQGAINVPQSVILKSYNFLQTTDTTLSIANQPADAKATGDKINTINNIMFSEGTSLDTIIWVQGYISPSDGRATDATNTTFHLQRIRTKEFNKRGIISIKPAAGYRIDLAAYNGDNYLGKWNGTGFDKASHYMESEIPMYNLPNEYSYVISIASDTNINTTYYTNCIFNYNNLDPNIAKIYDTPLTYLAIGSSTTEGTYSTIGQRDSSGQTNYTFPYWIAKENNYSLVNIGHGGGGWLNHGNRDNNNSLSLIDNILKAQAYNENTTYSLGQCAIKEGDICRYAKQMGDDTKKWIPLNLGTDAANAFANINIITIQYGVNDFKAQWKNTDTAAQQWTLGSVTQRWKDSSQARIVELGNSTIGYTSDLDSKLTVIGAMSIVIENLARLAPTAQIIIMLPGNFKKLGTVDSATPASDEIQIDTVIKDSKTNYYAYAKEANNYANGTHNWENKTLADYRAAMKECAEYYGVKTIDTSMCAVNRINIDTLLGDGIHPTIAYYKQIGYAIAPHVR